MTITCDLDTKVDWTLFGSGLGGFLLKENFLGGSIMCILSFQI